jgi:hypothetical protein
MKSSFKKVLGSLSAFALAVSTVPAFAAEGPSASGFIDFGYNYNFNGAQGNMLRSFDATANSFTVQNAETVISGKGSGDVSYRVDVDYGFDAVTQNASDGFETLAPNAQVNLQQAFISAPCPLTGGVFTVGKFVTPFGAEVIEAKDNINTSRGHLFNFAIPLTHTGVKYDKSFGKLGLTAGVVNAWDKMKDNNTGKTLLLQGALPVSDKLKVVLGGSYGPEQTQNATSTLNGNARSLVDAVVSYTADKLTLVANWDWGTEEGVFASGDPRGTANWAGLALLGSYAFSDSWSLGARWETLDDEGSRTSTEQVLNSATVTLQKKMESVTTRLEVRQDGSSDKVYVDSDGMPDDSQTTVSLQWIYSF